MGSTPHLFDDAASLTERLEQLHDAVLERVPSIERIACALYDAQTDVLKTFVNSTRSGHAITRYEYLLSESRSLSQLAQRRSVRVIDDISAGVRPGNAHSDWLLEQGYRASFTAPMYGGEQLLGFMFFDASSAGVFSLDVQRNLMLYVNLIAMSISAELASVRALLATAKAARDFVGLRDFETGRHLDRMAHYARLIARGVAVDAGLNDEIIEHIYLFAPLHDIGKIGVPDRILLKPGPFSSDERREMQHHVVKGVDIVREVLAEYQIGHLSDAQVMLNIVAHHHEMLDGSGYPQGLQGDAIPIEARIVAVADILDALTSERPYKQALPFSTAIDILSAMASEGRLDPRCVAVVRDNPAPFTDIATRLADEPPAS